MANGKYFLAEVFLAFKLSAFIAYLTKNNGPQKYVCELYCTIFLV